MEKYILLLDFKLRPRNLLRKSPICHRLPAPCYLLPATRHLLPTYRLLPTAYCLLFLLLHLPLHSQKPKLIAPVGHTSEIRKVAFSPDEQYVMSASLKGKLILWELETGRELWSYAMPNFKAEFLAMSNDLQRVFYYDKAKEKIIVLAISTKEILQEMDLYRFEHVSPDGKTLLVKGWENSWSVWDVDTGKMVRELSDEEEVLGFSEDGNQVLFQNNGLYKSWNLKTGEVKYLPDRKALLALLGPGSRLAENVWISSDGKKVIRGSVVDGAEGKERLFEVEEEDIDSQTKLKRSEVDLDELGVHEYGEPWLSPSGRFLLLTFGTSSGDEMETLTYWDFQTNSYGPVFGGVTEMIRKGEYYPAQQLLGLLQGPGHTQKQRWLDVPARKLFLTSQLFGGQVNSISADKRWLFTYDWDAEEGVIWNYPEKKKILTLDKTFAWSHMKFLGESRSFVFGKEGKLQVRDFEQNQLWEVQAHPGDIDDIRCSDSGTFCVSCIGDLRTADGTLSGDWEAKVWDLEAKKMVKTFNNQQDAAFYHAYFKGWEEGTFYSRYYEVTPAFGFNTAEKLLHAGKLGEQLLRVRHWDLANATQVREVDIETTVGEYYLEGDFLVNVNITFDTLDGFESYSMISKGGHGEVWDANSGKKLGEVPFVELEYYLGLSADAKFLFTYTRDNYIGIKSVEQNREVARVYFLADNGWIVTTPEGLFDASPGAEDKIHFVVNYQNRPEVIGLDQIKGRYLEKDLLQQLLAGNKLRPVDAFDNVALYPKVDARINQNVLEIELLEREGGIGRVAVKFDGKELVKDARVTDLKVDLLDFQRDNDQSDTILLEVIAYAENNWLPAPPLALGYVYAASGETKLVGRNREVKEKKESAPLENADFYGVFIGTSKYKDPELTLSFCDDDAREMKARIEAIARPLFEPSNQVNTYLLTTDGGPEEQPTKENIEQLLTSLKGKVSKEDVLMLYFSGHDETRKSGDEEHFYYLTKDIRSDQLEDESILSAYGVSVDDLSNWLNELYAKKQVMIFDACYSGRVGKEFTGKTTASQAAIQDREMKRMNDVTGVYILSGSSGDRESFEHPDFGHGLLTYSLMTGMPVVAKKRSTNAVDIMDLFAHAVEDVPILAKSKKGVQKPEPTFPDGGKGFSIGVVNSPDQLKKIEQRTVYVRSRLVEETYWIDSLDLSETVNKVIVLQNDKGLSSFTFQDVEHLDNGIKVTGYYHIEKQEAVITYWKIKGQKVIAEKKILRWDVNDLEGMAKAILGGKGKPLKQND